MWRKQPPTVEEVRRYQYWWNRTSADGPNARACVHSFDVEDGRLIHHESLTGENFNPFDWGDEWAPCIPPSYSEETIQALCYKDPEPAQPHSCGPGCSYHFGPG